MEISKTEIGNALTSADENHILATSNDIYDETQQAYQSEINESLKEGKQDKLVSGTNIKTINGISVLGSGNITIEGGSIDTSGNYPNMTVGKATKLATPRKIGLTGGAVGTATNFDGSGDINIPVTKIDESALAWSEGNIANGTTLLDALYRDTVGNKLAFCTHEAITAEYSRDGGESWSDYNMSTSNKTKLVTPVLGNVELYIGGRNTVADDDQLRITIDAITAKLYFTINKILIYTLGVTITDSKNGKPTHCKIEYQTYPNYGTTTWRTFKEIEIIGQPGWNSISTNGLPNFGYASPPHIRLIRFTLYNPYGCGKHKGRVGNLAFLAGNLITGGNTFSKTGHIYGIDVSQNATFPANVTATKHITQGGSANQAVLGDGSLKALSEISPITDADAEILLDNHIHGIDIKASGDDVNINIIESTKNGNAWETTNKSLPVPVATQETAGVISAADKQKIDAFDYEDNTLFVGDGTNGMLSIGYESSTASADMRVFRGKHSTIHVTSYNDTTGGSIAVMESLGGKGTIEVNGDLLAELALSGAGQVRATLTKENEDGTDVKTVIDAEEGITAPKLATIGGTSEQILLGDGTLITFDELKAKLGLI